MLELGFGGGLNLVHLPPEVESVGAVEPSDTGWRLSEKRRARSSVPVERIGLDGQSVAAADASYDHALCTFTLCTIPDALAALAEVRRLVRPGGTFHFLEHGLSTDPSVARWQQPARPLAAAPGRRVPPDPRRRAPSSRSRAWSCSGSRRVGCPGSPGQPR